MANPLGIYSGPGEISLYDATNGVLHLGFNQEINVDGSAENHELLDGNIHQYNTVFKLTAPLVQSDSSLLAAIKARRAVRQEVTIVGFESVTKIKDVFVSLGLKRGFKAGEPHTLELSAQTSIEDNVLLVENILGTLGNMEVDGGGGVASGWTASMGTKSIEQTFLVGAGANCQQISFAGVSEFLQREERLPFSGPQTITFSTHILNVGSGGSGIQMRMMTLDADDQIFATYSKDFFPISTTGQGTRISFSQVINPSEPVHKMQFQFRENLSQVDGVFQIDHVQIEMGELTVYKENSI